MTNIFHQSSKMVCKFDEYFHPEHKRNSSQLKYTSYLRKDIPHKTRYSNSNLLTSIGNQSCHNLHDLLSLTQSNKFYQDKSQYHKRQNQNKNGEKIKKCEDFKLERLFPQNVTIKFQDVLNTIPNNRNQSLNNIKKHNTISPFKVFQMVENKYYLNMLTKKKKNQKKTEEINPTQTTVNSIFNVKSIKMLQKNQQNSLHQNYDPNRVSKYRLQRPNKYDRKLKHKTQFSLLEEIADQSQTNEIKKFGFEERRQKNCTIEPFSPKKSPHLLMSKKRKSKQLSPMSQSLCLNNIAQTKEYSRFDNQYLGKISTDNIFQEKLLKYMAMLQENAKIHNMNIQFPLSYSRNQLCFYVGYGNNSKLLKQTLKRRWWLGLCQEKKDLLKNNVIWTQLKDKSYYILNQKEVAESQDSSCHQKQKIIHNHFEQNQFLGNKKALFYNMKAFYGSLGENVFDYLPLTLHIKNVNDDTWNQFLKHFQRFQDSQAKNIWILKPGQNSNRGNGITVHKTIQSIKNTVTQNQKEGRTFILQKYIQKPFLYRNRKFDIRCYMLLTRLNGQIKGFWYKQGYIRTSGYEYTLEDCQNSFVHLTNDAIQQHCDNYGKYEDKNKLSYESFQKYLDENYNESEYRKKYNLQRDIIPKLKKVCIDSIKTSYKYLGKWREGLPTFELFGLDFMIDEEFNPWLIEINTNPCLETEGRVLEKVIVPLIDNVFKLTVDCVFPPPKNWSNSNKHLVSKNVNVNHFELVFQENQMIDSFSKKDSIKNITLQKIGQIDEDSQVYQENED